jgi:hypothetical protein
MIRWWIITLALCLMALAADAQLAQKCPGGGPAMCRPIISALTNNGNTVTNNGLTVIK